MLHLRNIWFWSKINSISRKIFHAFQVNDLYEAKNLYMIVDNLYALGGLAQKNGYPGPVIGKKMATQNKREFDQSVLNAGQSVIGLQYGSNKGASQAGMTAYGTGRQIRPDGKN